MSFKYFDNLSVEAKVWYQKNSNLIGLNIDAWNDKQPRGTWNKDLTKWPDMEYEGP